MKQDAPPAAAAAAGHDMGVASQRMHAARSTASYACKMQPYAASRTCP
jgi:hypothetical protein